MSQLLVDDALVDDMAACLLAVRRALMHIAEQHPDMDTSAIDDLLRRYEAEAGRKPPSVEPEGDS